MEIYDLISRNEEIIRQHSSDLTNSAFELIQAGASPQLAEELVVNALGGRIVTETGDKDLDRAYREVFKKIPKTIEPEIMGLVISYFLYETFVPPEKKGHIIIPKRKDTFRLPPELIWLMLSLSNSKSDVMYCPSEASLQIATAGTSCSKNVSWAVSSHSGLIQCLHDILINLKVQSLNPLKNNPNFILDKESTAVCAFPQQRIASPISIDFSKEHLSTTNPEVLGLVQTIDLNPKRLVALVGQGFLTSTGLAENWLKSFILEKNLLESVIELPELIIPKVRWNYALLVLNLNKKNDHKINMIDASQHYHTFPYKTHKQPELTRWKNLFCDIINGNEKKNISVLNNNSFQNNEISPKRHVTLDLQSGSNNSNHVTLNKIAYLHRGYPHSNIRSVKTEDTKNSKVYYEVNIKDIGLGHIVDKPDKYIVTDAYFTDKRKKLILQKNDILLSIKGVIGHVALVPDTGNDEWIPNQSFQVIRTFKYDPIVLFYQLLTDEMQLIFSKYATGSSVKQLKAVDVKNIKVLYISNNSLINQINNKHNEILDLRDNIQKLHADLANHHHYINKHLIT